MPNLNVLLAATLQLVDTTLSPSPTISTRSLSGLTLSANAAFYEPFFQVNTLSTTVNLPATTVYIVFVRNLSAANNITVTYTPSGGASTSVILLAGATQTGGLFLYYQTAETAGGITALSLTAANAVSPAEVLVAA